MNGREVAADVAPLWAGRPAGAPKPSSRSILLTLLGGFCRRPDGVFQQKLVQALVVLGVKELAARQAIGRARQDDWLCNQKVGRRAVVTPTPELFADLDRWHHLLHDSDRLAQWRQEFLMVIARSGQREVTARLRRRLRWAGLGHVGGGLWISPWPDREPDVLKAVSAVGHDAVDLAIFRSRPSGGEISWLVSRAWNATELASGYDGFVEAFAGLRPQTELEAFTSVVHMVHSWRGITFPDPALPDAILPAGWPPNRARDVFRRQFEQWSGPADEYFDALG